MRSIKGFARLRESRPHQRRVSACGDFFVVHQDGNTGMLLSRREPSRKVGTQSGLAKGLLDLKPDAR